MKTITLTSILMIALFSTVAFATSVSTDYEGMGEFHMQTTIIPNIGPVITDTVDAFTGCDGGCCCCPYCFGEYAGSVYVASSPFSAAAVHKTEITDGCLEIEQTITEFYGDQSIQSIYYTFLDGTGTGESYIYIVPAGSTSYQLANGTGTSHVSFSQISYIGTDFDFSATYGGTVWACAPGYAGLYNQYYYNGGNIYYNSQMGLYCSPVEELNINNFLFTSATDVFSLCSTLEAGDITYAASAGTIGESNYGFTSAFYDEDYNDVDFDFEMELG